MNLWETFFLCFSIISFFLSILMFLKKKGNKRANFILGVYLLLFSYNLFHNVLYWSNYLFTREYINFFGTLSIVWVLYPPLIYFYIKLLTTHKKFKLLDLVHFIPVLIISILNWKFFNLSAINKLNVLKNGQIGDYFFLKDYETLGVILLMVFYSVFIYRLFVSTHIKSLNIRLWLKWVIGCFYSYVVLMIVYFILSYLNVINTNHDYIIMFSIILFIGMVAYFGFMQPEVFSGLPMRKVLPFRKYMKTGLSQSLSLELKNKLITYMENEKPYLNSELRLHDMANDLNLSKHHMSQIINEHFDATFFFFINTYRVREAKEIIIKNKNLSISEIIFLSGFNNRVSFYKAFKIHSGVTPKDYREKYSHLIEA